MFMFLKDINTYIYLLYILCIHIYIFIYNNEEKLCYKMPSILRIYLLKNNNLYKFIEFFQICLSSYFSKIN